MHTNFSAKFSLDVTGPELRLITLALAGKLKDLEDIDAAIRLNTVICAQRVSMMESTLEQYKAAHTNAENIEKGLLNDNR